MPVQKIAYSIPAVNDQATSIDAQNKLSGGFSFSKGTANVRFSISAQDRLLDTSDMYLTGQIVYVDADGDPISTPAAQTRANRNLNNGANLQVSTNTNISNWVGIQNAV